MSHIGASSCLLHACGAGGENGGIFVAGVLGGKRHSGARRFAFAPCVGYNLPYFFRTRTFIMSAGVQAQERIDLRTSPEIKELIVRAATTTGMSVSAFLLGTAQERARQILAETETITLTAKDWAAFAQALDHANQARPKLVSAVQRHRDWENGKRGER
jgi:uncharacterized protein (DUF1778 family)